MPRPGLYFPQILISIENDACAFVSLGTFLIASLDRIPKSCSAVFVAFGFTVFLTLLHPELQVSWKGTGSSPDVNTLEGSELLRFEPGQPRF